MIARSIEIEKRDLPIYDILENGPKPIVPFTDEYKFAVHLEKEVGFLLNEDKTCVKFCDENLSILKAFTHA
jgi:hypothetical protein